MKTLYIVRHAKSSWDEPGMPDSERPLNERGKKDAPEMARRLLEKKIKIDAFVSSPAKRANKTCRLFCKEFGKDEDAIILTDKLYEASSPSFYEVVRDLDNDHKSVAIFSHNPGITDFVNSLCKDIRIDNMPTCSVFAIEAPIKKWKEFQDADKKFLFFEYPKKQLIL